MPSAAKGAVLIISEKKTSGIKNFFEEFKAFAMRGNVLDMAVGVVVGSAFTAIVNSLVNDIISPIIGLFFNADFSEVGIHVGDVMIGIGAFITAIINFLIVAFVLFWQYFGYYTIIFTAGIKGIPYDIMEAAEVDGANKFQTFFHIVLPQLRNIMTYAFVTSIIGGLQLFDLPFTFAGATGGPSKSVLTMVMYMYNIAFQNYDYGYGSAISYGLFVIIIVFSLIFMKYTAGKERNF